MKRIANTSNTPSKGTFCACILRYIEYALLVRIFSLYLMPASESFFSSGRMNSAVSLSRSFSVAFSLLVIVRYCSGSVWRRQMLPSSLLML